MYKRHIFQTIRLSFPMIVGQLGQLAMAVEDNVMVGRVGPEALAAASIGNGLFTLVMVVGIGISMAVTPLTAISLGSGRPRECGVVLRQGLVVNLLAGILLTMVTVGGAGIIRYLNQPDEIVPSAVRYTQVLGLSLVPMMLFQTFRQFAEGISFLKPAMIITLLANAVNILVNWVFIYGNLGAPALGLTGAGWATFFSRLFMAVVLMTVVMTAPALKSFDPSLRFRKLDFGIMARLLKIGIPGACQYFFEVSAFAGSSVLVGWIGAIPLAAHQIVLNLASISFLTAMGISGAATIRVGNAVGRNSRADIRTAGFSAALLCGGFMVFAGVCFVLMRQLLPALYVSDPEVIRICAGLLVITAFFQVSDGTQAVGIGMLRGLPDMKIPTLITLVAYWVIGLPLGYWLAFPMGMGIYGIWYGFVGGLTTSALLMMLRFHHMTKIG